ncbi:phosphatidylinositol-specific phospholipase C/glycerophosphodiester phosphodiesterase family protein [Rhodopseudomonas telluris]|uniref:Phosphatidylinositol-specific phospholipase C/glycerophosphodiester phosphodiesterase family protein n=1 Tax=Rhodopseudomonas telluris TaxID=644215 RepID=A0ABV6EPI5_9BRAD
MILIAHRRNTRAELQATPATYGIEMDVRSSGDELIVVHDPFQPGERLEDWLTAFQHRTLILNVKEEGLEQKLIETMKARDIEDYFFLDQSFPFLVKWAKAGVSRAAVRVSEYESIDTAMSLAGLVQWIWVDCFTRFPLSAADARRLTSAGFKLCVVSPELQGRPADSEIPELQRLLRERQIQPAAVCTKRPDLWEQGAGS